MRRLRSGHHRRDARPLADDPARLDSEPGTLEQAIREHVALVRAHRGAAAAAELLDELPVDLTAPAQRDAAPQQAAPQPRRTPRRRVPVPALAVLGAGALALLVGVAWLPGLGIVGRGANGTGPDARTGSGRTSVDPWADAGPRTLFPFAPSRAQRVPGARDALPPFWADGHACAVGCRPAGAIAGWPLQPFHRAHALRAGLNERRPSGFHVGIDIQARDGQRVYAVQPGRATVLQSVGVDSRVQVGSYIYWHIHPTVAPGESVTAYRTVVGTILPHAGHLHLSEVLGGVYLNPLRPGGRVLSPWRDTSPPVIGHTHLAPDGTATVAAFDPQSMHVRTTYDTPVLAPAALAYAVFDARGRRAVSLQWALRGSHHLPPYAISQVYTPTAHSPGWNCFAQRRTCVPDWSYRLAGGLAPSLSTFPLSSGRYRLAVYAWDWAGSMAVRNVWFRRTALGVHAVRPR